MAQSKGWVAARFSACAKASSNCLVWKAMRAVVKLRAQRGGQHEKQRCKRGQGADAAQKIEHHEMA
tara:strand:+ start:972 stop:1169 length:198 start_codon:yes stop_codon:yes gene_type:complete